MIFYSSVYFHDTKLSTPNHSCKYTFYVFMKTKYMAIVFFFFFYGYSFLKASLLFLYLENKQKEKKRLNKRNLDIFFFPVLAFSIKIFQIMLWLAFLVPLSPFLLSLSHATCLRNPLLFNRIHNNRIHN